MKIHYFLISESFNANFAKENVSLQQQLQSFLDLFEMFSDNEIVYYSLDLYDQLIANNQSLVDWLYSESELRDEKKLFQLKLKKMEEIEKSEINSAVNQLQNKNYYQSIALFTFFNFPISSVDTRLIVNNSVHCFDTRRFYLGMKENAEIFLLSCESCFPNLFILDRVYQTLKRMKPFRDFVNELILHLSVLNDHAQRLFNEHQIQNETVVLKHLEILGNIHCSVQGDPAYEKEYLNFEFPSDEQGTLSIICSPHTKLFNNHSNERIYFNWGHPLVKSGKKLLIAHIGDHL